MKTNLWWQEAWHWGHGELIVKVDEGTVEGYRNVLYLDYSSGYTDVNISAV